MLQQTRVAAVVPYFDHWMAVLPTVRHLAAASEHQVLDLWAGLGYYTRPRRLLQAARLIVRQHQGRMPNSVEGWSALPGIGRYTAGAICSIAFNQPVPIVDGNITRVLSRLWGLRSCSGSTTLNRRLWALAQELVLEAARLPKDDERRNCADFNQALMELGATVCTHREPRCPECPLARACIARRQGKPTNYPLPARRPSIIRRRLRVLLLERRGRFFIQRAASNGWNAGLWEFPKQALFVRDAKLRSAPLFRLRHTITRHQFAVEVCQIQMSKSRPLDRRDGRWLRLADLRDWPLSGLHRKIFARLERSRAPSFCR